MAERLTEVSVPHSYWTMICKPKAIGSKEYLLKLRLSIIAPLLFAASSFAQGPAASLPLAKDILSKAIERAKFEKKQSKEDQFGWTQVVTEEKLGKEGQVEEHKTTEYDSVLLLGRRFLKITKINGQPPSGDDLKKANEREKK